MRRTRHPVTVTGTSNSSPFMLKASSLIFFASYLLMPTVSGSLPSCIQVLDRGVPHLMREAPHLCPLLSNADRSHAPPARRATPRSPHDALVTTCTDRARTHLSIVSA